MKLKPIIINPPRDIHIKKLIVLKARHISLRLYRQILKKIFPRFPNIGMRNHPALTYRGEQCSILFLGRRLLLSSSISAGINWCHVVFLSAMRHVEKTDIKDRLLGKTCS